MIDLCQLYQSILRLVWFGLVQFILSAALLKDLNELYLNSSFKSFDIFSQNLVYDRLHGYHNVQG